MRRPLAYRSVQVGLGGVAVGHYLDGWIIGIRDVTGEARQLRQLVAEGKLEAATRALPEERPYPLPASVAAVIGASAPYDV